MIKILGCDFYLDIVREKFEDSGSPLEFQCNRKLEIQKFGEVDMSENFNYLNSLAEKHELSKSSWKLPFTMSVNKLPVQIKYFEYQVIFYSKNIQLYYRKVF